jgi:hypothetical protein
VREFNRSRLLDPSPLIFQESAYEGREAGFSVFTVEPCYVPSSKRGLHWEVQETALSASLKVYTPDNLSVSINWLVF